MRCKGCDKSIDVKWRSVTTEENKDIVLMEDLCSSCLFWADVALNDLETAGLRVDLGAFSDEYTPMDATE